MPKLVKCKSCGLPNPACYIMVQIETFEAVERPPDMERHFGVKSWPICLACITNGHVSVQIDMDDADTTVRLVFK
jgi:hypothetical protein